LSECYVTGKLIWPKAYYQMVSVLVTYPASKQIGVGASNRNQICLNEIMDSARFGAEMHLTDIVFLPLVASLTYACVC
jgi:hypothetical protein